MQPGEMLWRASCMARLPLDYAGKVWEAERHLHQPGFAWWEQTAYPITHHREGGTYPSTELLGLDFAAEFEFDWHRDYSSEKMAPRKFAGGIDIRDPEVVGDVKCIWEINRHQYLSALAYSDHPAAEEILVRSLRSWLDNNSYQVGVNWTSSLEFGLRIISWAWIYPALRGRIAEDPRLREAFASSVYLHLKAIRGHLSRYSSANNHLLGELAGLYIGSICFPWRGRPWNGKFNCNLRPRGSTGSRRFPISFSRSNFCCRPCWSGGTETSRSERRSARACGPRWNTSPLLQHPPVNYRGLAIRTTPEAFSLPFTTVPWKW